MYCQKCGSQLNENLRFCPNCGTPIAGEEQHLTPTTTYVGPMGNPTPVLVWGIIGLALSCTFYLSIAGFICSIIGLNKANRYVSFTGGAYSKQANIGRRLSIAGIIVGAILSSLMTLAVIGTMLRH